MLRKIIRAIIFAKVQIFEHDANFNVRLFEGKINSTIDYFTKIIWEIIFEAKSKFLNPMLILQ